MAVHSRCGLLWSNRPRVWSRWRICCRNNQKAKEDKTLCKFLQKSHFCPSCVKREQCEKPACIRDIVNRRWPLVPEIKVKKQSILGHTSRHRTYSRILLAA